MLTRLPSIWHVPQLICLYVQELHDRQKFVVELRILKLRSNLEDVLDLDLRFGLAPGSGRGSVAGGGMPVLLPGRAAGHRLG